MPRGSVPADQADHAVVAGPVEPRLLLAADVAVVALVEGAVGRSGKRRGYLCASSFSFCDSAITLSARCAGTSS